MKKIEKLAEEYADGTWSTFRSGERARVQICYTDGIKKGIELALDAICGSEEPGLDIMAKLKELEAEE